MGAQGWEIGRASAKRELEHGYLPTVRPCWLTALSSAFRTLFAGTCVTGDKTHQGPSFLSLSILTSHLQGHRSNTGDGDSSHLKRFLVFPDEIHIPFWWNSSPQLMRFLFLQLYDSSPFLMRFFTLSENLFDLLDEIPHPTGRHSSSLPSHIGEERLLKSNKSWGCQRILLQRIFLYLCPIIAQTGVILIWQSTNTILTSFLRE